jgi:hypothetical protein
MKKMPIQHLMLGIALPSLLVLSSINQLLFDIRNMVDQ